MPSHLSIRIYSADQEIGKYHASEVRLPSFNGQMGILADHTDYGGAMSVGVVELFLREGQSETKQIFFISGGFFEVKDNQVTLLVQTWEEASSVDGMRALESKRRALSRLAGGDPTGSVSVTRALASLRRAELRLSLTHVQKKAS